MGPSDDLRVTAVDSALPGIVMRYQVQFKRDNQKFCFNYCDSETYQIGNYDNTYVGNYNEYDKFDDDLQPHNRWSINIGEKSGNGYQVDYSHGRTVNV